MELDYYLFKHKIQHKTFAEKVGIQTRTLSLIVNHKTSPSLITALKIYFATDGKVSIFELLKQEDRENIYKIYSIVKKESIYKDDIPQNIPHISVGCEYEKGSKEEKK